MRTKPTSLWQILDDTEVYSAPPWIKVHRQQVRLPNGRIVDDYHQIVLPDYTIIAAQTADGKFVVERHHFKKSHASCVTTPRAINASRGFIHGLASVGGTTKRGSLRCGEGPGGGEVQGLRPDGVYQASMVDVF